MEAEQPIIVIKKKVGHAGHHGGAWKVAYADFVTAMMALFIVLWLLSSTSKQTQEEIAGYFNDPKGTAAKHGSDGKPIPKEHKESKETKEKKDDMQALKEDLLRAIHDIAALNRLRNQIEIAVTEEGLRIDLIEDAKGTFFESGSAAATPALKELLAVLAGQLKGLPNSISIEGHTDAAPYVLKTAYSNWELSTDRANVARREMQMDGVRLNQVSQVRGFADQRLRLPNKPFDAANRRVSLVVQNLPRKEEGKGRMEVARAGAASSVGEAKGEAGKAEPGVAPAGLAAEPAGAPSAEPAAAKVSAMAVSGGSPGIFSRVKGMFH